MQKDTLDDLRDNLKRFFDYCDEIPSFDLDKITACLFWDVWLDLGWGHYSYKSLFVLNNGEKYMVSWSFTDGYEMPELYGIYAYKILGDTPPDWVKTWALNEYQKSKAIKILDDALKNTPIITA